MMVQNRIRMLRKEAGYNQKELGEILKVGQTTVSAWETGRSEPPTEFSNKMAKLFGCSIGYLMGYEDESEYRGLSEKEWRKFIRKKHSENEQKEDAEQGRDREDEELQRMAEDENKISIIEEWEKSRKTIFPETIEIDAIMEELTTSQRKALLNMVKSAKQAFRK